MYSPHIWRRFAVVKYNLVSALVTPTYISRLSSSSSERLFEHLADGKIPSSHPARNTIGNSRPFEACSVIRVTLFAISSIPSISDTRETCDRNSPSVLSNSSGSNSFATLTSSCKFSILVWSSSVPEAVSSRKYPLFSKIRLKKFRKRISRLCFFELINQCHKVF